MTSPFNRFFQKATNGRDPYPYQERFATADGWPHLLRAPTGAGKTATAVLGWLYRWTEKAPDTPRRLVYCLPMRVLVEQSFGETLRWLHQLGLLDAPADFDPAKPDHVRGYRPRLDDSTADKIAVHRLMGGIEAEEWHLHPERPAVLIGTQDMLLSRALNRGYAASRFHWPIDFGLLNNDCLWVFDEPQLMGSGVSSSAQLAGLRQVLGTFGPCPSVWMSATLEPGWLDTIDFRGKFTRPAVELGNDSFGDDYDPKKPLYKRMTATKTLAPLGVRVTKDADEKETVAVATKVLEKHRVGTQTLVVLNTVKRAKLVYQAIRKLGHPDDKLLLVHSRFRPHEREGTPDRPGLNDQLQQKGDAAADRIIVATQVVEAGVDISARTLVTELAPWASIVQRIGRCNRTGDDGPGAVFWIDAAATDPEKKEHRQVALPYLVADLNPARDRLETLAGKDVSPRSLEPYRLHAEFPHTHVLRRRDLLGLFDTSPDLSGNDIDIKHYVRGDDPDLDVKVFWRDGPPDPLGRWKAADHRRHAARREELCNVPVGGFKDFLKADKTAYRWDFLDNKWRAVSKRAADAVVPGQVFWVPASQGGYDRLIGWEPTAKEPVPEVPRPDLPTTRREDTGLDTDDRSRYQWRSIAGHTDDVMAELDRFLIVLWPQPYQGDDVYDALRSVLRCVVRWHDWGKAHEVFQYAVEDGVKPNGEASPTPRPSRWIGNRFIAKAPDGFWRRGRRAVSDRSKPVPVTRFRHELASALGVLELLRTGRGPDGWQQLAPDDRDTALYLLAAHHGKVRLSVRAMPEERPIPADPEATRYAAGVWDGDRLPDTVLGDGVTAPAVTLDLSPMLLGGDSWAARTLGVRDRLGPFRLAYLEAIVRAADCAASARAGESEEDGHV